MKNKNHQVKPKEKIATTPNMAFFFAVGFAAFASVILFSYVYFTNNEHASQSVVKVNSARQVAAPQVAANDVQTPGDAAVEETAVISDPVLPSPRSDMVAPAADLLQGFWVFQVHEKSVAELSISGDQYQLIYADQSEVPIRKFSRGSISYDEQSGRLTLRHDSAAGAPEPMRGVQYEILTTRIFDMDVLKAQEGDEIYLLAPQEHIASKSLHPLFLFANYNGPYILKLSPLEPKQ